jgi:Transposase DDE domain/Transposase domain (DUF772)
VANQTVPLRSAVSELVGLLDSPEITGLIVDLEATRWTGRPGYPIRTMVGMALAKSIYGLSTWTRTVALVREHSALQAALGCEGDPPSEWAAYRFAAKLREHRPLLDACIAAVVERVKEEIPDIGEDVAIDASDMPAYANGQRFVSKGGRERAPEEYSDPDASWGHRSAVSTRKGGGFYGYRLHMAVDAATDLPLAWRVETARSHETNAVAPLLDKLHTLGIDHRDVRDGQGLRQQPRLQRVRRARRPADHSAAQHARRESREALSALLQARRLALRGSRPQPEGDQVALPDR